MRHRTFKMARIGLVAVVAAATLTIVGGAGYAAADVTVSGKVSDGSGHAWPLYARIEVSGLGTFYTNPGTGRYSFTAPGSATYSVTVSPVQRGYQSVRANVVVGTGNKTQDFPVPVTGECVAPGYSIDLGAPLLNEPFDSSSTPAGWQVVNRTDGGGWAFTDLGNRSNLTGGSGNFAIVDSDFLGVTPTQDTDLITPALNLSTGTNPFLRFQSDFRAVGLNDRAAVEFSTDGGANWGLLWEQTASRRGPRLEEISLQPLATATAAQIRFHYIGSFDWWWEVDDVQVVNRQCTPTPGGLVVGVVTDRNTGDGLNGARVFNTDNPREATTTVATPDDPNLADGFYSLFTPASTASSFTASKAPYDDLVKTTAVTANAAKRLDFPLKAGRLEVTPTSVGTFQPYGSTRSTGVTFTNTGTAPVTVNLLEQTGGFVILLNKLASLQGAAPKTITIPGGASKAMHENNKVNPSPQSLAPAPAVDDAWQQIPDYPTGIMDNSGWNLNGTVYVAGGAAGSGDENRAFAFSPDTGAWRELPNMPHMRTKPQVVGLGGKIYVFGGWATSGAPESAVDVYDTAANTWTTLQASNPKPRAAAGVALAGGKFYLIGGCIDDNCTDSADVLRFDPANGQFNTSPAAYPHTVSWISCGGITGKIYCAGGTGVSDFTDGFKYDPATNSWSAIRDLPLQLWGSAHAAANDLLIIMGGVTADSTVLTNRVVGYDPATDSWIDLPDAGFTRYRGAGACGGYKIGGSSGGFSGVPQSERLGGLDNCALDAVNVPWLSESPATFTLAAGASRVVTVSLTATAAAGISQPGKYTSEIKIAARTPYSVPSIEVEMNVLPPDDAGKVQGVIRGQGCSGAGAGLPATLKFMPLTGTGTPTTLVADASGRYAIWLSAGDYNVIIAKDGWTPELKKITVSAGFILTFEPPLTPLTSC